MHCIIPRYTASIFDEVLFPVDVILIAATSYEFLELPVRYFVLVQPVAIEFHGSSAAKLESSTGNPNHSGRTAACCFQREVEVLIAKNAGSCLDGFKSLLRYSPP